MIPAESVTALANIDPPAKPQFSLKEWQQRNLDRRERRERQESAPSAIWDWLQGQEYLRRELSRPSDYEFTAPLILLITLSLLGVTEWMLFRRLWRQFYYGY